MPIHTWAPPEPGDPMSEPEGPRPARLTGDERPLLPTLGDGHLPDPEPIARTRTIRIVAIAALLVSAMYLVWRAVWTIDPAAWFIAVPMIVLEVHHAVGLGLYTFSLWDVNPVPPPPPVVRTDLRVAVLIPTYDESVEVLLPVITAALAIGPAHETWVLDDGRRPQVERLAADLGARYLSRPDNTHAKAGNLNNALAVVEADIVAVIDADHVVLPGFLTNTLGYFEDPRVAVVQTPQDFYNLDSFEHQDRGDGRRRFNEQAVFYRVILPAKNRWDAVFWCGTGALVRVEALRAVGGVATDSVTEDIHTSIRMHKQGWRIVAHNEVLARGLAAEDARAYLIQRERWARGAMQVMKRERLLTSPELTPAQRLAYAATLVGWFDSLRSLLFVLLPVAVLFTGMLPIDAPILLFGPMFLGTFLMQFLALRLLARGYYPPILSLTFETLRMPAVVPALGELLSRGRERRFRVTPKGGTAGSTRRRSRPPMLLVGLVVVSLTALTWAAATLWGLTPLTYGIPGAVYGTAVFLVANVALLMTALRRIRSSKFAGERRNSVRFPVRLSGTVGSIPVQIVDLSLTGARVLGPHSLLDLDHSTRLEIDAAGLDIRSTTVRVRRSRDGSIDLGLQFIAGQWDEMRSLSAFLFHGVAPDHRADPERVRLVS